MVRKASQHYMQLFCNQGLVFLLCACIRIDAFSLNNGLQNLSQNALMRHHDKISTVLPETKLKKNLISLDASRISESVSINPFPTLESLTRRNNIDSKVKGQDISLSDNSNFVYNIQNKESTSSTQNVLISNVVEVGSAVLLITGNTVGATTMVLPDVAAGPGMTVSAALFVGLYIINLVSGLLIAEVALNQYHTSCEHVPSSFKAFSEASLPDLPQIANVISFISISLNWCVLAFGFSEASKYVQSPVIAAMLSGLLVATQTNKSLSKLASVSVVILFATFASMLVPGLFLHSGSAESIDWSIHTSSGTLWSEIGAAAPILVSAMVYQNIVPSITKLLNYDRTKTTLAIALGSFLPMVIYLAWIYGVLSGAVSTDTTTANGHLYDAFCVASIVGCTIAGIMSVAEEFESFLRVSGNNIFSNFLFLSTREDEFCVVEEGEAIHNLSSDELNSGNVLSTTSVILAVVPALIAASAFSHFSESDNFTAALSAAGGYGSPLLYGLVPIILASTQRYNKKPIEVSNNNVPNDSFQQLVPGGVFSLGILSVSSVLFVVQEFYNDMAACLAAIC
jgi:tyrosine-specific transport protein